VRRLVSLPSIGWGIASITKGSDEDLVRSGGTYTAKKSLLLMFCSARIANRHR